jgi:uncharacterized membrane protein YuzA (DUF378 family)
VLGRKQPSVGERITGSASSTLARANDRLPGKLDGLAAGALVLGMANWFTTSVLNFDAVQAAAGKRSMSGRTMYGLLGLSAAYATVRGARKAR